MTVKPDRANPEDEASTAGETAPQGAAAGGRGATAGGGEPGRDDAVAAERARADENWDKYLRAAAELENVRKRAARDAENARKFALERFATELLAVRDSLEMGLAAADAADVGTLIDGNRAILKQLTATMERFGVVELDPEGEPFDPSLHEAMTTQPSTAVEPNTVVTVFQKGYLLNGRLLRPARVVVAATPE